MGACDFRTFSTGKTAREAFNAAVNSAQWDHGHAGYTGTIAEKHSFVSIPEKIDPAEPLKARREAAIQAANRLIEAGDQRIDDKWGPAGCIDCGPGDKAGERLFLFFGWASS